MSTPPTQPGTSAEPRGDGARRAGAPAWIEVKRLVADALELPLGERHSFVEARTVDNAALRERVMALVSADETQEPSVLSADGLEGPRVVLSEFDATGPLEPGEMVGRYRIVRLIGAGGMGAVYEARDDELGRDAAIKVIVGAGVGLAWSTSALKRFSGEAKALARLAHPGIAQIFETGTHRLKGGVFAPYFVLELVRGGVPITAWARGMVSSPGHPSSESARGIVTMFQLVCESVAHGHQKGVIHRDLKPANILIDAQGKPKLIDFGVARTMEEGEFTRASQASRLTREGQIVGTIQYMSPEQCTGDGKDVDIRSDVYSLGVVLHELLAGDLPYDVRTSTLAAASTTIREASPRPLGQISKELAGDLERIVLKALDKEPARRYQSASEFAADLHRFLAGEAIIARSPSATYQLKMFARRHRALVVGTVAAVACLSLGVVGTTVGLVRARQASAVADAESARSNRLSHFVLGMIGSAGAAPALPGGGAPQSEWERWNREDGDWKPAGLPGHVASVAEVFAAAVHRIPIEFADDPLLMADAACEVLGTMSGMGLSPGEEGMALAEESAAIYERELGLKDRKTILAHFEAAQFLALNNYAARALDHQEKSLQGVTALFGWGDPRTSVVARTCANTMVGMPDRRDEALQLLSRLRTALVESGGEGWSEVGLADLTSAYVMATQGKDKEAITLTRAANARLRAAAAEDPNALIQGLSQLASFVGSTWEGLDEAERAISEAVELAAKTDELGMFANEHRYRHMVILLSMHRYAEAEAEARKSLEVYEKVMPPEGLNRLKAQARLASILIRERKDLDEAQRLAKNAAEVYGRIANDPNEEFTQHHYSLLAATTRLLGDPVGAEQLISARLAIRLRESKDWRLKWSSVSLLLEHGRCLTALGRFEEAERELTDAASICRTFYKDDPTFPTWSAVGEAMVELYEATGRDEEVARWQPVANHFAPEHP